MDAPLEALEHSLIRFRLGAIGILDYPVFYFVRFPEIFFSRLASHINDDVRGISNFASERIGSQPACGVAILNQRLLGLLGEGAMGLNPR